ncbi:hypothetical protein RG47T_2112 [Mucilaginibacter polytrichastri]|uniref:Uncharacterized protein n=1 Tax=Mucilaginibacter polytrichastri TaxID=1302689 RepID=A0A1Q5ZY18_9SPHI|nr:hypothetical protein RG47T_2112 [Mucilaginibacter polytrichastri]
MITQQHIAWYGTKQYQEYKNKHTGMSPVKAMHKYFIKHIS